jgi:tetratricopeptide (TPR) repeat protein
VTNRFHKLELEESLLPATNQSAQAKSAQSSSSMELQPDLHDSRYWMGQAMQNRRIGNHEEALRFYSRAVELDRTMVSGWVGQVQMLIALAEYPEAELWARKALELFRNHADLLAAITGAVP